jgi:hypothetical protein
MLEFFAAIYDEVDKRYYYFNREQRAEIARGKFSPPIYEPDVHCEIMSYYGLECKHRRTELLNFRYNPSLMRLTGLHSHAIGKRLSKLNWSTIIGPLKIDRLVNPLSLKKIKEVDPIVSLKSWLSNSDQIKKLKKRVVSTIGSTPWETLTNSIWFTVKHSLDVLCNRVNVDQIIDSYALSFYQDDEIQETVSSLLDMWFGGYVPSYDPDAGDAGVWRLHRGRNAEIVDKIKSEDMK